MSGKLPAEGCSHVEVIDDQGQVEARSMIYTEYFVRGTQPTDMCDLHPSESLFEKVAGAFGKETGAAPVPATDAGLPATEARATGAAAGEPGTNDKAAATSGSEEPAKRKRGFWSRLFGGSKRDGDQAGSKDADRKKKTDVEKPREPQQP
jgi:hypothetical protein